MGSLKCFRFITFLKSSFWVNYLTLLLVTESRGGLVVSALVPGASVPGSSPGRGHCVVFLGKTFNSECLSPPRSIYGYRQIIGET